MKCVWKDPAFVTVLLDELKRNTFNVKVCYPHGKKKMGIVKDWIYHPVQVVIEKRMQDNYAFYCTTIRMKRGNRTKGE